MLKPDFNFTYRQNRLNHSTCELQGVGQAHMYTQISDDVMSSESAGSMHCSAFCAVLQSTLPH